MMDLSPQRAAVLDFIRRRVRTGRGFPTRGEIARHMGWKNETSVYQVLQALHGLGHLRRFRSGKSFRFSLDAVVATDFAGDDDLERMSA